MNVTTNAILVAMVMISVTKRVGVFTPRPGKNARQNFSFKGAQIFLYWYNDHKTIFAHNRGDMHCIKSHIHFQVSPSTSEIFNKNLKIGRFYPGLPYSYWKQFQVFEKVKFEFKLTVHYSLWAKCTQLWPLNIFSGDYKIGIFNVIIT